MCTMTKMVWFSERLAATPRRTRPSRRDPGAPAANREGRLKSRDELAREVEVLGERIATLSAAVLLRLGSSLDLPTVLQDGRRQRPHAAPTARYSAHRHRRRYETGEAARVRHLGPRPLRSTASSRRVVRRPAAVSPISATCRASFRLRRPARLVPRGTATPTSWCARRPCRARRCAHHGVQVGNFFLSPASSGTRRSSALRTRRLLGWLFAFDRAVWCRHRQTPAAHQAGACVVLKPTLEALVETSQSGRRLSLS